MSSHSAEQCNQPPGCQEMVIEQLNRSYIGYRELTTQLNSNRPPEQQIPIPGRAAVHEALEVWLTREKLDLIDSIMKNPKAECRLMIVPNAPVSADELLLITHPSLDRERTPVSYRYMQEVYRAYSPEQLSGYDPQNTSDIIFSIIPSNSYLGNQLMDIAQMRIVLMRLQQQHSCVGVPTVLQSVAYSRSLPQPDSQNRDDWPSAHPYFESSAILHFNLPPYHTTPGGKGAVPFSCIDIDNIPRLEVLSAGQAFYCRVAIN